MTADLRNLIRDIPDFPEPGILFRDITPLLADGPAFQRAIDWFVALYANAEIDVIVGIESRGFILAGPIADRLRLSFVPIRKPGKLPAARYTEEYVLEYGEGVLEIHQDALQAGQRAVVIDDLLATGGTAMAAAKLVEACGAKVHGLAFLVELTDLNGRDRLIPYRVASLIPY